MLDFQPIYGINRYLHQKRLEKLKSNLKQFYSIRIDKQWRIIFKWENNNVYCVEIIDYY
ncbi:MAG: type II toxin-antitoxin system RelE/ParE family toxin [Flavobacterium sp.]|nr:type II toxin-antitoxin system RelE/ParE family toxin [Pedobacter sp.]